MGHETRANRIMELLRKNGTVEAAQLSRLMQVSVVTIRKDLQRMEEEGLLHRTHGGAAICGTGLSQKLQYLVGSCFIPQSGLLLA